MSNTVNVSEVTRFELLAETWWQQDGPMWPLHKLNDLRAPYVTEQICTHLEIEPTGPQPLTGLSILDIGCGAGLLAEAMAKSGAHVTAIDPAERNISIAQTHASSEGLAIDYRLGGVDVLHPSEQFDVVLNMEVVEHVDNLPGFLASCCAHTRPNGLQFIATINRTFTSWLVAIIGAEYILRWLPKGTHQWRKFVRPAETSALLEQHNHMTLAQTGVSINPLTKHYRLADHLGVNYMMTARREG